MASREDVYIEFGRAAEIAQMLEREIGTALLALDGLETKSYLNPDADAYRRLTQAIEAQTLGGSLRKMGKYFDLKNETSGTFSRALETRNRLAHRFYAAHGLAMIEVTGRDKMVDDLREIQTVLSAAYAIASPLSSALVKTLLNSAKERQ
jgi:Txe/YoeB family toxin of Txe-Axe toxin-antitoxin module